MGLDMYLARKIHIANYEHDPVGQVLSKAIMDALGVKNQDAYKDGTLEVTLPAAYWRKANAIHAWFVKNVQDGEDDCREYDVDKSQLTTLRDTCADVLAGKLAPEAVLPAQEGYFFGTYEYGDWYRQGLQDTIDQLDTALANPVTDSDYFAYRASW